MKQSEFLERASLEARNAMFETYNRTSASFVSGTYTCWLNKDEDIVCLVGALHSSIDSPCTEFEVRYVDGTTVITSVKNYQ